MTLRNTSLLLSMAAALVVWTVAPSQAQAQQYQGNYQSQPAPYANDARGFYAGLGLAGTRILRQDGGAELLEHGAGLTLYGGLRINHRLAVELGWMGTLHNPVAVDTTWGPDTDYLVLNGFTVDAKIFLGGSNPRLTPFVQAGLGAYILDSQYFGAQSAGTGFQAGGGFDYQIGPRLQLGLRGLYRGMAMGPPDATYTDTFVSALTVEGNISLRF